MGANVESDIKVALFDRLRDAIGLWPVAYPNVKFTVPSNKRYLRVSHQPNETQTPFLRAGEKEHEGLLQVTVVEGIGKGDIKATDQASLVVQLFKHLTEISSLSGNIQIPRQPSVAPGFNTKTTYELPVTIRYRLFSD